MTAEGLRESCERLMAAFDWTRAGAWVGLSDAEWTALYNAVRDIRAALAARSEPRCTCSNQDATLPARWHAADCPARSEPRAEGLRADHDGTYRHHHHYETQEPIWWENAEQFAGEKREHRHWHRFAEPPGEGLREVLVRAVHEYGGQHEHITEPPYCERFVDAMLAATPPAEGLDCPQCAMWHEIGHRFLSTSGSHAPEQPE